MFRHRRFESVVHYATVSSPEAFWRRSMLRPLRASKACQPFHLRLESASSALTEVCIVFRHFLPGNRFGKFDFAVYCMGGCNAP